MEIKILGTGCTKCKTLEQLTRDLVLDSHCLIDLKMKLIILNFCEES